MKPAKRVNYLNNKSFLTAIHEAKKSFCWYEREEYSDYDAIVSTVEQITPEMIEATAASRSSKAAKAGVPEPDHEVVFRVMDDTHIPLECEGSKRRKPVSGPLRAKVGFPPFKHYAARDGDLVEVGRSHWVGSLSNGEFSADHGKISNNLARMFMLLVAKYASRGNYRGYSYNEEMQGQALVQLSQVGLQFNEFKSDNPFAFYTQVIKNCFTRILNLEKRNQVIRDDVLMMHGMNPSNSRMIDHSFRGD